jgi:hypothetical protein
MWAAQQGHGDLVHELLMAGASAEVKDRRGYTAAELAGLYKHPLIRTQIRNHRARLALASVKPAAGPGPVPVNSGASPVGTGRPGDNVVQDATVPVKADAQPKLVAVVGSPEPSSGAKPTMSADLQERLMKFDVDRNRVIDGRDWRNLVATNSRITLAAMLHDVRCGKRECLPHAMAQVLAKLDWVYGDPARRELTLNQAWEVPSYHFEQIRW